MPPFLGLSVSIYKMGVITPVFRGYPETLSPTSNLPSHGIEPAFPAQPCRAFHETLCGVLPSHPLRENALEVP